MSEFVQSWSSIFLLIYSKGGLWYGKVERPKASLLIQGKIRLPSQLNRLGLQCKPNSSGPYHSLLLLQRVETDRTGVWTEIQHICPAEQNFSILCGGQEKIITHDVFSQGILGRYYGIALHIVWCQVRLPPKRSSVQEGQLQVHRSLRLNKHLQHDVLAQKTRRRQRVCPSLSRLLSSWWKDPKIAGIEKLSQKKT